VVPSGISTTSKSPWPHVKATETWLRNVRESNPPGGRKHRDSGRDRRESPRRARGERWRVARDWPRIAPGSRRCRLSAQTIPEPAPRSPDHDVTHCMTLKRLKDAWRPGSMGWVSLTRPPLPYRVGVAPRASPTTRERGRGHRDQVKPRQHE